MPVLQSYDWFWQWCMILLKYIQTSLQFLPLNGFKSRWPIKTLWQILFDKSKLVLLNSDWSFSFGEAFCFYGYFICFVKKCSAKNKTKTNSCYLYQLESLMRFRYFHFESFASINLNHAVNSCWVLTVCLDLLLLF